MSPDGDELFRRFFAPWYAPDELRRRGYAATRADVERAAKPGTPPAAVCLLAGDGPRQAEERIAAMRQAVARNWPAYLGVRGPLSMAWIDRFDKYWNRARIRDLVARSDPADGANDYLALSCELGVATADVMTARCPQLAWLHDWPFWESGLLDVPHGYRLSVFHWAIKRLTEQGVEAGYPAKIGRCLDLVRAGWPADS